MTAGGREEDCRRGGGWLQEGERMNAGEREDDWWREEG